VSFIDTTQRSGTRWIATCILIFLLSGCAVVGPRAINSGRLAYNESISKTNEQQMLMEVLRGRYEERGSLLAVSSVTANVRVVTTVGLQAGAGNDSSYAGNLVPLSAGAVYEENPTISYTPVAGEKYLRQVMSPVPVPTIAQMATSLQNPQPYLIALISSINGIYNPEFTRPGDPPDERFAQVVAIMSELIAVHRLHWVRESTGDGELSILLDHTDPAQESRIRELLSLLGLPPPAPDAKSTVVPVALALDGRKTGTIGVTTRSVFKLIEVLSAAVDVPPSHISQGMALEYPPPGLVGQKLRIHRSETRPEQASVAVRYRDHWYFVDDRDLETKRFFKMVGAIWSSNMAEASSGARAPMLTVPVSR